MKKFIINSRPNKLLNHGVDKKYTVPFLVNGSERPFIWIPIISGVVGGSTWELWHRVKDSELGASVLWYKIGVLSVPVDITIYQVIEGLLYVLFNDGVRYHHLGKIEV
jgi:hypothetical protein